MGAHRVEGLIIRVTGHEVWVDIGEATIPCLLRGRFRKKKQGFQVVAGDRVEVSVPDVPGTPGSIEGLVPRKSWLSRYTPRDRAERVIVANIGILFLIVAVRLPALRYGFVDRVLVSAERGHNDVHLVVNKIDLLGEDEENLDEFTSVYDSLGYPIMRTSAETGEGLDELKSLLSGGIYAFVGLSGVGKSTLLNYIDDSLNLKVSEVAGKTGRGRHTTTFSQLYPIAGGYVADTPGMQTFGFSGTDKNELSQSFREFRELGRECRFQPCTHSHEPDCAVKEAHERGVIAPSRYRSYLTLLEEVEARGKERY